MNFQFAFLVFLCCHPYLRVLRVSQRNTRMSHSQWLLCLALCHACLPFPPLITSLAVRWSSSHWRWMLFRETQTPIHPPHALRPTGCGGFCTWTKTQLNGRIPCILWVQGSYTACGKTIFQVWTSMGKITEFGNIFVFPNWVSSVHASIHPAIFFFPASIFQIWALWNTYL